MAFPAFQAPWQTSQASALLYDFTTELSPGVWKVYRKDSKVAYLAYDITNQLFTNPEQPWRGGKTELWNLMKPDTKASFTGLLVQLLSHENLVGLLDVIQVRRTSFGGPYSRERWYTIWDFCDAGNLGTLLTPNQSELQAFATQVPKPTKFRHLPESLCWHVLTSVLKALAWLHDGTSSLEWNADLGYHVEMGERDPDWQPVLHRNIAPENIFFMYPKRGEAYGICKLGNFGTAFITGHNAVRAEIEPDGRQRLDPPQGPHGRYIITPPPGQDSTDLENIEDLRERDWQYKDMYPPLVSASLSHSLLIRFPSDVLEVRTNDFLQTDQPYTLVSEYRALGEVIQAMMVPPAGNDHMRDIRCRSVRDNLIDADYSKELKRFVQWLMEMSIFDLLSMMELSAGYGRGGQRGPLVTNCTSALYANAIRQYYEFRDKTGKEGRYLLFVRDAILREQDEDNWKAQQAKDDNDRAKEILDTQDKLFGMDKLFGTGNPTGNTGNTGTTGTTT